jgi:threonylcarbamoyladenosine tRNA methylthiotransferase MtaB
MPADASRNTVSFYTLGCRLNFADTGAVRADFEANGFSEVPFGQPSDVTVLNSCSVTEEADRKCRQIVRRALRANPDAFVIVTGCYAQLQPGRLADIEGVDAVVGTAEKFRIFDLVRSFSKAAETQIAVSCIDDVTEFGPATSGDERTRAFLKVQDGCDYSCAFCTIPRARGSSRSHRADTVIEEARRLAAAGFPEVVLSGVNIGLFRDGSVGLVDLLRRLDAETTVPRFRISSIEPNLLTDELVDFVGESRSFMRHFHIPLQSGDDVVLGRMRRRYRSADYRDRVEYVLERMPDACIGCDVIVGHPGETDDRFFNTVRFLRDLPVAYLHVFTYSERPNTTSASDDTDDEDRVAVSERRKRCRQLRALSEQKRAAFQKRQIGRTVDVVWERGVEAGMMSGYSDNFVRLRRTYDPALVRQIERVVVGPDAIAHPI